jgi:hypothetical protein
MVLLAVAAQGAFAAAEIGDAGDLPLTAQEPGPAGPLASIEGSNASPDDRDMYRICLTGGGTFSASTIRGAGFDSQLFLFDAGGMGVYANDDGTDDNGRRVLRSGLPADHAFTPQAAGVYYLAISSYDWDPRSTAGPIFASGGIAGPTGEGGALPIFTWGHEDTLAGGPYTIALTGTRSCVDTTAPVVHLRTPPNGAEYARDEPVLADYDCADEPDGSGLASCAGPVADGGAIDTSTLGPHTFAVTAVDQRGNATTVTHSYTVFDATDPTVQLSEPADGAEYARGEPATADYECLDEAGGSGIASCDGPVADGAAIDTSTLGQHTFAVTAVDGAGNSTTVAHSYRVVDEANPTVTLSTPADGAVYDQGDRVPAEYECLDEAGGSGIASCTGPVADGAPIDTSTPGPHSFAVTATDVAGNSATVTHSYTVVDHTPPTIHLRTPADGATYARGRVLLADYDCDGGTAATCVGDVPDGAAVDTATAGTHTFTVSSRDLAGNESTETATYRVEERRHFGFRGFLAPVLNRPRVNVGKAGWIVPVRFKLDHFRGYDVVAAGYPRSRQYPCGSSAGLVGGTPTVGVGHHKIHYSRDRNVYIYLWRTDRAWAGQCRQFVLKLADGSYHRADFRFPARRRR